MTLFARLLAVLALLTASALPVASTARAEDNVIGFAEDDAEMNAAIQKARDSLPLFWAVFRDKPPEVTYFSLKVGISDGQGTEHFWTRDIELSDGRITAIIDNDPVMVKTVKRDQRVDVLEHDISDWMFVRNGKIVGGETLRVMLKQMSPEERAAAGLEFETP